MHSIRYTMFDKKRGKEQFPFQTETSVARAKHFYMADLEIFCLLPTSTPFAPLCLQVLTTSTFHIGTTVPTGYYLRIYYLYEMC